MPRSAPQNIEINNLSGGLNTEANPLMFPPNMTLDEQNMLINKDGSRKRRNGLDSVAGEAFSWTDTIPLEDIFFNSARTGNVDTLSSATVMSFSGQKGVVRRQGSGGAAYANVSYLEGIYNSPALDNSFGVLGDRFVTASSSSGGALGSVTVTDNGIGPNFGHYTTLVRDFWGSLTTSELNVINERWKSTTGNSLTDPIHLNYAYNLHNGTWPVAFSSRPNISSALTNTVVRVISIGRASPIPIPYFYPAMTDNFWNYVSSVTNTASTSSLDLAGSFVEQLFADQPKNRFNQMIRGSFTINPFDRSGWRISRALAEYADAEQSSNTTFDFTTVQFANMSPTYDDKDTGYHYAVTEHLGRIWCAADATPVDTLATSPDLNSMIFFSKVVDRTGDWAKFHSDAVPGEEEYEGPEATAGGFITITGMDKAVKLLPLGRSLIVLAKNGVWQIDGGEENFSASSFQLKKLSSTGIQYPRSAISTGDTIYYWAEGGIYKVSLDNVTLSGVVANIAYNTVNKFPLSVLHPERISGAYDRTSGEIRWLFCEDGYTTVTRQPSTELVLDGTSGAFSLNRFPTGAEYPHLVGYLDYDRVTRSDTDRGSSLKLVGVTKAAGSVILRLYDFTDESFLDYPSIAGGVDTNAYLLTGYLSGSDSQRDKQVNYITCNFRRTEDGFVGDDTVGWEPTKPSSCLLQTQWEWTNSPKAGKWGRAQQAYRHNRLYIPDDPANDDWSDYSYTVINTRTKVRGQGKVLSMLFQSEPGKDFHLYGWGTTAVINSEV